MVTQDAKVVVFTVPEFEQLVSGNTRIIIKMLQVFSNQLRRIHKQVQNLLNAENQTNPEEGLFNIGEYYLKAKKYNQALYALKRYLVYYPSGQFAQKVTGYVKMAKDYILKYGEGSGPPVGTQTVEQPGVKKPEKAKELSDTGKKYYNAVTLMSQNEAAKALAQFTEITQQATEEEYKIKAFFDMGKCYFSLKQYDNCLKCYMSFAQKYPKHPEMKEALHYIGMSYEKKGDLKKAIDVYKRVASMTSESDPLHGTALRSLRNLEKG